MVWLQEADSLRLYEILERVGLSEEMRLLHRRVIIAEIIHTVNLKKIGDEVYYFGSLSEGSTVYDMKSDIDVLNCDMTLPVVTCIKKVGVLKSIMMLQDDHTYPGYVKVQRVLYGIPLTIAEMNEDERFGPDVYGRICLKHYREQGKGVHGPAIDYSNKTVPSVPLDFVPALKCASVPASVKLWLLRKRQYGWPKRRCMIKMATLPHFLVGVGHPYSVDYDIEWRISYSLHERELMFSLNPTQHKCYGTMKMIKKDVIEPAVGEQAISSYHLKTCLFWAIEKTPSDIWRPDQLLHCLNRCFFYLLYFVLTLNCPNYFRANANLFEREVFLRLQDRLSSAIKFIIQGLPGVVSRIKCADVGRIFLNPTWSVSIPVLLGVLVNRASCNKMITTLLANLKDKLKVAYEHSTKQTRVFEMYHLLYTWTRKHRITEHTEEQTDQARQLILPCLHFSLATSLAAGGFNVNNGAMCQYLLQMSILHLTQSSTRDLMGARLMYVTILYKQGRYRQCEAILQQIERYLQSHVISDCSCDQKNQTSDAKFMGWIAANKLSVRYMISATISCVTFLPSESELVPVPLQYELNRSRDDLQIASTYEDGHTRYDWACVDGKVFFHLMKYLVNSRLYAHEEKDTCRKDLLDVINNDPRLTHKDTAYNVLDWINAREHRYDDAFQCWTQSLVIQPYHNAVLRYTFGGSFQN